MYVRTCPHTDVCAHASVWAHSGVRHEALECYKQGAGDSSASSHRRYTAQHVARQLKLDNGFRLVVNDGRDGCQSVCVQCHKRLHESWTHGHAFARRLACARVYCVGQVQRACIGTIFTFTSLVAGS